LERICTLLEQTAGGGEFQWQNKQVVHFRLSGMDHPWASIQTKKSDAVYLILTGPKGRFTQGRVTGLGHRPQLAGEMPDRDLIRIKFRGDADLERGDLVAFLKEHVEEKRKAENGKRGENNDQ
jgi:hypothetical protein